MSDEDILRRIEREALRRGFEIHHPRFTPNLHPDQFDERLELLWQQRVEILRDANA